MGIVGLVNDRELLIYLHSLNGVGSRTINKILANLTTLNEILDFQPLELSMKTGIDFKVAEKIVNQLNERDLLDFLDRLNEWGKLGIDVITFHDQAYPEMLKEIAQPSWVLFTRGDLGLFQTPSISIVGTRNPTPYGRMVAEQLAKDLSEYGWVITSGMARGIDRFAHEGALKSDGKTIAVLGNGIDVIYPKENKKIYEAIIEKGLIVSEYPPGTQPHPGFFPQRNRIISGLTYGTIVVEASLRSGSLITAQYALEQSREVFAVPGPITSKQSFGTNALIKQGAKCIQEVNDILEEFPYLKFSSRKDSKLEVQLSESEEKIYSMIHAQIHINEIIDLLSLTLSEVYEILLSLQLKDKIKQLPGGFYMRKN
ncbi:DNA-processing protein DprA [Tepidibacillus decaturensis]|uniref:Uncharacterized protein n=1 Tax=Tepidibacillus decaturensis TaxID=1413211 RepID=A0A135L3X6_9BACI|nr:DNA-processing protein DprA [Tepidibacillus decaturensis]KXG43666.1 hypothetical protein U473_06285 [Tepidibacillus decaturensis]